jgi:hypothetical protein
MRMLIQLDAARVAGCTQHERLRLAAAEYFKSTGFAPGVVAVAPGAWNVLVELAACHPGYHVLRDGAGNGRLTLLLYGNTTELTCGKSLEVDQFEIG